MSEFVERRGGRFANLGLFAGRFCVRYCGIWGAELRDGRRSSAHRRFLELVRRFRPAVVYIHIGENDVRQRDDPRTVLRHIRQLVTDVSGPECIVIVSQLLPFPAMSHRRHHIDELNRSLMETFRDHNEVQYWRHRGGFWTRDTVFNRHGVHVNEHGAERYWHSVRTAVIKGLRAVGQ